MTKHEIKLEPYPMDSGRRGDRKIMVDGEQWGTAIMQSHGPTGNSYTFHHPEGMELRYPADKARKLRGNLGPVARVRGDRMHRRLLTREELAAGIKPLNERIIDEARKLIEQGILKSPKQRLLDHEAAAEKFRAERMQRKAKEDAEFRKQARSATNSIFPDGEITDDEREQLVDAIITTMRWAQTQ